MQVVLLEEVAGADAGAADTALGTADIVADGDIVAEGAVIAWETEDEGPLRILAAWATSQPSKQMQAIPATMVTSFIIQSFNRLRRLPPGAFKCG